MLQSDVVFVPKVNWKLVEVVVQRVVGNRFVHRANVSSKIRTETLQLRCSTKSINIKHSDDKSLKKFKQETLTLYSITS